MKLRIVLLPDEVGDNFTKELSKNVGNLAESDFILDQNHFPHVTVLSLQTESSILGIWEKVKKVSKPNPMESPARVVVQPSDEHYVGLYFNDDLNKQVEILREKLINQIKQMKNVTICTLDNPTPHLTLNHLKDVESKIKIVEEFSLVNQNIRLNILALALEGDQFGTCQGIINQVFLNNLTI